MTVPGRGPEAAAGSLVLLPPGDRAALMARAPCRLLVAEIQPVFLDHPDFDRCRDRLGRLFGTPAFSVAAPRLLHPTPAALPAIRSLLLRLGEEPGAANPAAEEMRRLRLAELLILLEQAQPDAAPGDDAEAALPATARRRRQSVDEMVAWLQEHYADELTLPSLAARCTLSPAYFSRLFHQDTGVPVFEYLNRLRVKKACGLLKRTDLTVLEIALAVGYNNVSFFNRYFRRVMNRSPREYRQFLRQ